MLIDGEIYLTAEEIAVALKVKPSTVYGWVRRRQLACVKIGPRLVRFRQGDVKKLTRHPDESGNSMHVLYRNSYDKS
jgi:excisionase family DNA binding protein